MIAEPRTAAALLDQLTSGPTSASIPLATGFEPLDEVLNGGLRPGELTLVGGKPGVGKTVATLQWARRMVLDGRTAVYVSYEHSQPEMIARLLAAELGQLARTQGVTEGAGVRAGVADFALGWRSLDDIPDPRGLLADAVACVSAYADRLWIVPASSSTGVAELARLVGSHPVGTVALFVDHLHKVPLDTDVPGDGDRAHRLADAMKALALDHDLVGGAGAPATTGGLTAHRQRLHHLRGAEALAYEADLIVMLNEKVDVVSRLYLTHDPLAAERFRQEVVFSVEKHRSGPASIDLEFVKDFAHYRFEPTGRWVPERLVDDRIVLE